MALVLNFFGGPCSGKSSTASGVFSALKFKRVNCEYVSEYAKDLVWEKRFDTLKDQLYVFAKQYHAINILNDKVDVIVTDSPILLNSVFGNESEIFKSLVLEKFNQFENLNIFLHRNGRTYEQAGRTHTEEEAKKIDELIKCEMVKCGVEFYELPYDEFIVSNVTKLVEKNFSFENK